MASVNVKHNIVSALCKHLYLDPKSFSSELDKDLKSLCMSILKSSKDAAALVNDNELIKWIGFVEKFLVKSEAPFKALTELNEELITKSVVLGNGLKPSAADVIVFSVIHSNVISLSSSDRAKLPHLLRWMDYIQNKEEFAKLFETVSIEKTQFIPQALKTVKKVEDSNAKKTVPEKKDSSSSEKVDLKEKKPADSTKKSEEVSQAAVDKKKLPEKEVDKKEEELSVSLLKIQIGLIHKAWKHPSADSLLVEEIDIGEAKCRQVVSGLAKYCIPDQLTNRRVVLITNVKPGKLRDVMSEGLVLCASNQDHTVVEPLIAPEGAKIGECVTFSGHDGKPEDVLNPKKKQLDKITPHLSTDGTGVATFKGIPFMTSSGPCTSTIPNASIK
ncbi:probable methionine--tRNA ligase [Olea europaea subsp. europaea]|uniref:Probable methionine--tRNA ligase n=2 Tax=Olea europaea subsp. europaea TaxID=158383 RepID=A0A8S0RHR4_OLEEU|nr:probable methionine--tRNA ligase [Olea europaea subsp. europaea]